MHRRWLALAAVMGLVTLAWGCATSKPGQEHGERLYLALQIQDEGKLIATPKLLGETGRRVSMRLVDPEQPDRLRMGLQLVPEQQGDTFKVKIGLTLPDRSETLEGKFSLLHGEERKLVLETPEGPVQVKLMLMRVESPEFQALMTLARDERA